MMAIPMVLAMTMTMTTADLRFLLGRYLACKYELSK